MSTSYDRPSASTPSDRGHIEHLTSATFDEAIATSDRPVLVDFTARCTSVRPHQAESGHTCTDAVHS